MGAVFISYRRGQGSAFAARVRDELKKQLPYAEVFLDVSQLNVGENFEKKILDAIRSSSCFFLIVSEDWNPRAGLLRRRRLDNPRDFVRQEIAAALQSKIPILPILVDTAPPLSSYSLPADLSAIESLQCFNIRHAYFSTDMAHFFELAKKYFPSTPTALVEVEMPWRVSTFNSGYHIAVDGSRVAEIANGDTRTIRVPYGKRSFSLEWSTQDSIWVGHGQVEYGQVHLHRSETLDLTIESPSKIKLAVEVGFFSQPRLVKTY